MLKIEKKVPLTSRSKYPWKQMEVGDSFFVHGKRPADLGLYQPGRHGRRKFSARTVNGGVRVWRVK